MVSARLNKRQQMRWAAANATLARDAKPNPAPGKAVPDA